MDYYEELGLKRTATVQEIRQAYRVLARLVHPDGQANKPVREMAERQMKRLNQILTTLTDLEMRREYDAGLENANRYPPAALTVSNPKWRQPEARIVWLPAWFRPVAENGFWISLALVVAGVAAWYVAQVRAENRTQAAAKAAPEAKAPAVAARRVPLRDAKAAPRAAKTNTPKPNTTPRQGRAVELQGHTATENTPGEASKEEVRLVTIPQTMPVPAAALVSANAPASSHRDSALAATPPGSPFAGNWLYAPDPNESSRPGFYPAKYVELLMSEEHGRLRGTYRAEYRILDRAVSPVVTFELEGDAPPAGSAHLTWNATDGAKGDIDLALAGPNVLRITWWTTEFGRHSKLASGTSKLIRRQTP